MNDDQDRRQQRARGQGDHEEKTSAERHGRLSVPRVAGARGPQTRARSRPAGAGRGSGHGRQRSWECSFGSSLFTPRAVPTTPKIIASRLMKASRRETPSRTVTVRALESGVLPSAFEPCVLLAKDGTKPAQGRGASAVLSDSTLPRSSCRKVRRLFVSEVT
jgi:hypothetical protein